MHVVLLGEAERHDVEVSQEVVEAHPEGGTDGVTLPVVVVLLDDFRGFSPSQAVLFIVLPSAAVGGAGPLDSGGRALTHTTSL